MARLEIACFNVESALIAQAYGAARVELCANKNVGGTTPSDEVIVDARGKLNIKLNVMIRPRGGNFVYSQEELKRMKEDIIRIKNFDVDGLVFGALDESNMVNINQNQELIALAYPLPCTFHRAFDEVKNLSEALEDVIYCGFDSILTSGGKNNVGQGINNLKKLFKLARERIVIMPGGGLRSTNIEYVLRETNAKYFHSSAITSSSEIANGEEIAHILKNLSL